MAPRLPPHGAPHTMYSLMGSKALTSVLIVQDSKVTVKIELYLLMNLIGEHGVKL